MLYNLKEASVTVGNSTMDYAVFGYGSRPLVIIPGLSLRDVRGAGLGLAYIYRRFMRDFRIYVIDKKNDVPEGYSVKDIADDTVAAMRSLGIDRADVYGVSLGGMVAQYIAVNYPEAVNRLILGVTTSRQNETLQRVVGGWISSAERGEFDFIINEMLGELYSESYARRYGWILPLLANYFRPKNMPRFINLAKACLTCDIYDRLHLIKSPTLVLGGEKDLILSGAASYEIAERIGCEIYMYPNLGHSAYDEAPDFNKRIFDFLTKKL